MSAGPMTTGPQLASGERLVSLEEAARLLRVSVATLQARMNHEFGSAGPGATRHLTSRQLDLLAKKFTRRRAGGSLSLDEAA